MRSISALCALAFVVASAVVMPGPARAAGDPAAFINDLGTRAIEMLSAQKPESEREKGFRALFDTGFDVPGIARFALGRNWQTATEAQRAEFTGLFTTYMIHVYAVRFNEFSGLAFKVTGARPDGDDGSLVTSQMGAAGGASPVSVGWRVAAVPNGFKITDVVVEGVSMAITQRQEFAAVIQRGGGNLEVLLKLLREKTRTS
jgi:phospholipid transport system substrate-binding protein